MLLLRLTVVSPWGEWVELRGTAARACAVAVMMVVDALNACEGVIPAGPLNVGGLLTDVLVLVPQIY